MLKKDVSKENIVELQTGFKLYLKEKYVHLSEVSRSTICSDSFFIIREDIGIEPTKVFELDDGIEKCRSLLVANFEKRGRKNPSGDASSYCRAIRYLKAYLCEEEQMSHIPDFPKITSHQIHGKKRRDDILTPCINEIENYLIKWDELEDYRIQEEALDKLFIDTYPDNTDIHDVLIKVSAVNAFYSTNIFAPYKVAKHIVELDVDKRLAKGDVSLVNDIAVVVLKKESTKNFYSFATKYCSRHKPNEYPIYDSYVDQLLRYFRDVDGFAAFPTLDLKDYSKYINVLFSFREFYGLSDYTLKQIDKYLWQLGKEKFPRKY